MAFFKINFKKLVLKRSKSLFLFLFFHQGYHWAWFLHNSTTHSDPPPTHTHNPSFHFFLVGWEGRETDDDAHAVLFYCSWSFPLAGGKWVWTLICLRLSFARIIYSSSFFAFISSFFKLLLFGTFFFLLVLF